MLTVNEIFYSIQGESSLAGLPCVFVRLTACDLRCSWCDTEYAFHEGRSMSVDDVIAEVERHGCPLVGQGRTVLLETGGHRPIARVPAAVRKIVDVKCPGSGEADRNDWDNLAR